MEGQWISWIAEGGFLQWGKIFLTAARDAVESLRFIVVRLEGRIRNRPIPDGARNAFAVISPRLKILLTWSDQGTAIQARASSQDAPHVEAPGRAVDVDLAVVIRPFINEHGLFVVRGAGR